MTIRETLPTPDLPAGLAANPLVSQWVCVRSDGMIEVRVGKVELGQGILTALAQVAADELSVGIEQVRMLPADTVRGPNEGLTSGSMSIAQSAPALHQVCACVRHLFVTAAASAWGVESSRIEISNGVLSSPDTERRSSYGDLAGSVDLHVTADPRVRRHQVDGSGVVGTSARRLDLPDKVVGRPRFIHDLRLPGQWFGRVVRPPSPGAHLVDIDQGVVGDADVHVVRDGSFLGVVGPDESVVVAAAEALRSKAEWAESDTLPDERDLGQYLRAGPHDLISVADDEGQPPTTPPTGRLQATYSRPFLAHASMAPSCGVAQWVAPDGGSAADGVTGVAVSVWSHSQGIYNLRDAIARLVDLDPAAVAVTHAEGAGCYGHNAADDAAADAVLLARAVPGRPVLVQWSRQDELAWAPFGSAMTADVAATFDEAGAVSWWRYDVWSQGHTSRPGYAGGVPGLLAGAYLERPLTYPAAAEPALARGGGATRNAEPGYEIPHRRIVAHHLTRTAIRSSALRALGAQFNVFAIESFMDEIALATGTDPLDLRLEHLRDERARRVLQVAADAAGWGTRLTTEPSEPPGSGIGRGIGWARYKRRGAYCAVVAEVEAIDTVRVRRLTVAVDVGAVVNPDGVRNQIEGGATQAASWTLKERVRFDHRRITSDDWESYPILRFSEAPPVDVHIVDAPGEPSVGAGEAVAGPTTAAIANAVAHAVAVRVRDLPITAEAIIAAIETDDQNRTEPQQQHRKRA